MHLADFHIRLETRDDHHAVEALTREAFWNHFAPGCDEHYLLHIMRSSPAFLPELTFLAECGGRPVGHIAYARSYLECDDGTRREVLCFGPLSVLPEVQGLGVGHALVAHSIQAATALGYPAILIMGDPTYYSRFGFVPAELFGIGSADDRYMDALQALELVSGALGAAAGRFFEGPAYEFDPGAVEAFDADFPPREKLSELPSQQRFQEIVAMQKPRTIQESVESV